MRNQKVSGSILSTVHVFIHLVFTTIYEVGTIIFPILKMKKQAQKE